MKDFKDKIEARFYEEDYRIHIQYSDSYIPEDIIHPSAFLPSFFFLSSFVSILLDLVLVDKIIIFTIKLYTNRHPLGGPILTLFLAIILICHEESGCQ